MKSDIACWLTVYNEESRIQDFLDHAMQWSSEIVVADKGSTDKTADICRRAGCKIFQLPYSDQGCEDYVDSYSKFRQTSESKWALWMTASDIPTKALIENLSSIARDSRFALLENFVIPVKIYSFGYYDANGPWAMGYQPRLLNIGRFRVRQKIHDHIIVSRDSGVLRFDGKSYIAHLTHRSFEVFSKAHIAYAVQEASESPNRFAMAQQALSNARKFDFNLESEVSGGDRQKIAWNIYWLSVALACIDKDLVGATSDRYGAIRRDMLNQWRDNNITD